MLFWLAQGVSDISPVSLQIQSLLLFNVLEPSLHNFEIVHIYFYIMLKGLPHNFSLRDFQDMYKCTSLGKPSSAKLDDFLHIV